MQQNKRFSVEFFRNLLGLVLLLAVLVALVRLSDGNRPAPASPPPSSPLSAVLLSPVSEAITPSLPASPVIPPSPVPQRAGKLDLTVLHTNDTWGYLLPCG